MPLDVFASEEHFADHLAAVLLSLPPEHRGHAGADTAAAAGRFRAAGLEPGGGIIRERPVLVAAIGDLRRVRRAGRKFVALMEHGAGQSYAGPPHQQPGRHPSYAGGIQRDADLFLHPGPHPAARDRAAYPRARVEIVGSPYADRLPSRAAAGDGSPVVAIGGHFSLGFLPETRSAFGWIRPELPALAERLKLLGHGHPRLISSIASWYKTHGIELVVPFDDVCRRADLLIADNTSALFLFAATGRPVVVLNEPRYRRGVEHGLRFWRCVGGPRGDGPERIGINVDEPRQLDAAVDRALELRPDDVTAREAALDLVFAHRGHAAERTAAVLLDWLRELDRRTPARRQVAA